MMRILIISDIHANLNALESVIKNAGQVDAVWCLGDLVGYGPDPNECIHLVQSLPNLICLPGNHDAAAIGQIDDQVFNNEARISIQWLKSALTRESKDFLRNLPEKLIIGDVTLCHGSPRNPIWEYILDTYTARENFKYFSTRLCLVGHTHLPAIYSISEGDGAEINLKIPLANQKISIQNKSIFNPGSVGQPRDQDPRAAYAIFYPETLIWESHRVNYDIIGVQKRIIQCGLPRRHAARLADGW